MNKKIVAHFQRVDPILAALARKVGPIALTKSDDYFLSLCREIINQQLASGAAHAIFNRFVNLFPKRKVTAEAILKIPDTTIRNVGPSWAKVKFIKDLAKKVTDGQMHLKKLDELDDAMVVSELTRVKGIGPWTAEMFLMFSLGRDDVFSYGDLGLRKAIRQLYKFKREPTRKQIEKITKKWSPYRTWACQILWRSLDR